MTTVSSRLRGKQFQCVTEVMPPKSKAKPPQPEKAKKKKGARKNPRGKKSFSPKNSNTPPIMTPRSRKRGPPANVVTGGPRAKQSKTCPLTAADIPDIVFALVQALPPQTGTTPT